MAGDYEVCLTVINNNGEDVTCQTIQVTMPVLPIATFSVMTKDLSVNFTNLSQNNPITSLWDFGDGNNSTDFSPEHIYAIAGDFEVCLTVTNNDGEDVTCQTIQVMMSVSTNTIMNDNSYTLMPNPATDRVQLVFEKDLPSDLYFDCYTITGERISMPKQMDATAVHFDISQLPKGVYLLRGMVNGNNWLADYFIVQ